jgi:murein DD-endopeptidase MepM/ murein hydrolase activator NlpD
LTYFAVFDFNLFYTMSLSSALVSVATFTPVIAGKLPYRRLNFTASNVDLPNLDLTNTETFSDYVFGTLLDGNKYIGVGGYDEHRVVYSRSAHFGDYAVEGRCIHLGVDTWADAGTPVHAPLDGVVHSIAFNDNFGDYGPTVIVQHELDGITFHTLYGHLSLDSLDLFKEGEHIEAGVLVGFIGDYPENGYWPPHLHFQVIEDMGVLRGDYPGVSTLREREDYLANCPDPNLILRIPELD